MSSTQPLLPLPFPTPHLPSLPRPSPPPSPAPMERASVEQLFFGKCLKIILKYNVKIHYQCTQSRCPPGARQAVKATCIPQQQCDRAHTQLFLSLCYFINIVNDHTLSNANPPSTTFSCSIPMLLHNDRLDLTDSVLLK